MKSIKIKESRDLEKEKDQTALLNIFFYLKMRKKVKTTKLALTATIDEATWDQYKQRIQTEFKKRIRAKTEDHMIRVWFREAGTDFSLKDASFTKLEEAIDKANKKVELRNLKPIDKFR